MSSDGAEQGVGAERALKTILGGEPMPTAEECETVHQMRERILAAPIEAVSYDGTATATARIILEAYERDPSLIAHPAEGTLRTTRTGEIYLNDDGAPEYEIEGLFDVLKQRFPEGSPERAVFSGLTGFMWGWAVNAARRCVHVEPVPNPAIVTVGRE